MKTDRELLELAAKAAGIPIGRWVESWMDEPNTHGFWLDGVNWNPLDDDGDSLQLAVKLRLGLIPIEGGGWDVVRHDRESCEEQTLAMSNSSNVAALRTCIVRAAAAIGESMQ